MAKAKTKKAKVATTCSHNRKQLGYLQWHSWAEKLTKKGIRQKQCPICKLWLFPEEFKTPTNPTTNAE
jgi:hypothetical protein